MKKTGYFFFLMGSIATLWGAASDAPASADSTLNEKLRRIGYYVPSLAPSYDDAKNQYLQNYQGEGANAASFAKKDFFHSIENLEKQNHPIDIADLEQFVENNNISGVTYWEFLIKKGQRDKDLEVLKKGALLLWQHSIDHNQIKDHKEKLKAAFNLLNDRTNVKLIFEAEIALRDTQDEYCYSRLNYADWLWKGGEYDAAEQLFNECRNYTPPFRSMNEEFLASGVYSYHVNSHELEMNLHRQSYDKAAKNAWAKLNALTGITADNITIFYRVYEKKESLEPWQSKLLELLTDNPISFEAVTLIEEHFGTFEKANIFCAFKGGTIRRKLGKKTTPHFVAHERFSPNLSEIPYEYFPAWKIDQEAGIRRREVE